MDDKAKIIEVINLYFYSMYESNAKLVKQVFHPMAKITGYVEDKLEEIDTNQFAKFKILKTSNFLIISCVNYVYSTRCALIWHLMGSKYPKGSAFASISQYDLIQSLSSYSKDRRATALASSQ